MDKIILTLAIAGAGLFASAAGRDQIVIPDRPTAVERTAAEALQDALRRIASDAYVVVAEADASADRAAYAVGATKRASRLAAASGWGKPEYDEIRRGTVDGCVVLDGHAQRGAIYAVDAFLEDVAGVRWWTAGESDYPQRPGWRPGTVPPCRYAPPFCFRETFYRSTLTDVDFKVRSKVNTTSYTRYILPPVEERFVPPEKGDNHKLVFFKPRRSAYHSFFQVLPPEKYAKDHPDWYSEIDGKRTGGGQLCVTNPEMLKEYVANTLKLLRESPDCDAIQVSQNDAGEAGVCRCAACLAAKEAEGAWSGPYLTFANKVAAAIEREFPHVTVDTFAYMFTRKAPKTVRPRHNVVVRLCDIECAFNRPLADPAYEVNRTFVRDLRDWSRVASGNLYLWDYQANFRSYMMPHPNLQVFSDNLRLFREAGAVGVFEQGDAMCPAGDFCALKCYVTSHLMWDPSKDWRSLADEFLVGYYGAAAAPHLKRVLEVSAGSASRTDVPPMGCYHSYPHPWITSDAARTALAEMDAALAAAERTGPVFARRVRFAKLSWDHAKIRAWDFWGLPGRPDGAVAAFRRAIAEFGIDAYRETNQHRTLVDYLGEGLSVFELGCDWVKTFNVDGRGIAVGDNHQLDFAKVYPDEVRKDGVGSRFAEATAVVDVERGGEHTLFLYMDWFGEISVNGGPVVKLEGACDNQDARLHKVTLKPGLNEIRIRVRAGSDGRWYLALGVSR